MDWTDGDIDEGVTAERREESRIPLRIGCAEYHVRPPLLSIVPSLTCFDSLGVALGLAFFDPPETPAGVQTFKTIIFQSTPAFFYLSIIIAVAVWTVELQVFDREREDGLYCAVPFVCASTLAFLPANIVFPMLYGTIIYFMYVLRLASSLSRLTELNSRVN